MCITHHLFVDEGSRKTRDVRGEPITGSRIIAKDGETSNLLWLIYSWGNSRKSVEIVNRIQAKS